jgi:putative phosphoesterase
VDRIALFSDVHANLPGLEAVLADIRSRGVSRVYCLGDMVGYGGNPNGVIDLIRASAIPAILGNYDEGVAWETGDCGCFYPDEEAKRVGEASYAYTVSTVTEDNKAYLRELPRELHVPLGDKKVHLVHGSPRRINEYLLQQRDERTYERLAASETDDILAFGHTHEFWRRRHADVLFVNVGTAGRPKDGDSRAGYAILSAEATDVEAESIRLAYDVDAAAKAILDAGLPPSLASGLLVGR